MAAPLQWDTARRLVLLQASGWSTIIGVCQWLLVPLAIAVLSRAVVVTLGYVSEPLIPDNTHFIRAIYSPHALLDRWYQWDASWYTTIALGGYQPTGRLAATTAFWPLLPLLEWAMSRPLLLLFPGMRATEAVAWAGVTIVFLSFVVGCIVLHQLVLEHHGPDVARRTISFLAFAPGAVYYTAVYPSSLLLVGVVGCFWALPRGRWALAGLAGLWAALAQVPGCLLALCFAWVYLRRHGRRIGFRWLWGLLIPLGPALWLAYLWMVTGDPLAPVTAAHTYWPHRWAWPWETLVRDALMVLTAPHRYSLDLVNLAAALGGLGGAVWALRSGQVDWGIWGLAVMALYLSVPAAEPFDGILRYSLAIVPTWLFLARLTRHPLVESAAIGLMAAFLGLLTSLYVNSFWVA